MSKVFALYTSDPNLSRCELYRLRDLVVLNAPPASNAVGLGSYAPGQEEILLQRYASDTSLPALSDLWTGPESEAVVYHAQALSVGLSLEENTQPFRFRKWMFAHQGAINGFERMRSRLLSTLPEFLQRQVRGDTEGEVAFALFLKILRETGRTDDRGLEPAIAAQLLGKTVRALEQVAAETGAIGKSNLNFIATNGRMLLATRYGSEPLYYALLEGTERCERCGIEAGTPDTRPLVREHRRRRTVAIASHVAQPSGWIEIPHGMAIAVDGSLSLQTLPI